MQNGCLNEIYYKFHIVPLLHIVYLFSSIRVAKLKTEAAAIHLKQCFKVGFWSIQS